MNPQAYSYTIKTQSGFWLKWICVTVIGFVVSLIWIEIGERPDLGVLEGAIGGLIIGCAQWYVLRQYIYQPWEWIIVNLVSWSLLGLSDFGAIGWVAPRTLDILLRIFYGSLDGFRTGIWIGLWQWYALRSQIPRAWKWIFVSPLCWTVGLSIGWTFGGLMRQATDLFLGDVLGLTLGWAIVGGMTGFALIRLLWIL